MTIIGIEGLDHGFINNIIKLTKRRQEFLEAHPHLQGFQDRLDEVLNLAGKDPIERCKVLQLLMNQSNLELQAKLKEVSIDVGQVEHLMKKVKDDFESRR